MDAELESFSLSLGFRTSLSKIPGKYNLKGGEESLQPLFIIFFFLISIHPVFFLQVLRDDTRASVDLVNVRVTGVTLAPIKHDINFMLFT